MAIPITYFNWQHLPLGPMQDVSHVCQDLAVKIMDHVPEGEEKEAGMRKLLEAKDCFVRATLP